MEICEEEFEQYVREAIDSIDPQFRRYLDEVPVIVEGTKVQIGYGGT